MSTSLLQQTKDWMQRSEWNTALILLVIAILVAVGTLFNAAGIIIGILLIAAFATLAFKRLDLALLVFVAIALILPDGSGSQNIFAVVMDEKVVRIEEFLLLVVGIAWITHLVRGTVHKTLGPRWLVITLGLFGLWIAQAIFLGRSSGAGLESLLYDIRTLPYYGLAFVAASTFHPRLTREKSAKQLTRTLLISSAVFSVAFILFLAVRAIAGDIIPLAFPGEGLDVRVNFRNTSLFFLPLVLGINLLVLKGKNTSIDTKLAIGSVVLTAIGILIAQTRSLWFAVIIALGLQLLYFLVIRRIRLPRLLGGIIIAGVLLVGLSRVPVIRDHYITENVSRRAQTFINLQDDASVRFRTRASIQTYEQLSENPIRGNGFGKNIPIDNAGTPGELSYVDNSYLTLAWKAGIPAVLFGLLITVGATIALWKWYNRTRGTEQQSLPLALLLTLPSLLLFSATAVMLTGYRSAVLFGVLLGFIAEAGRIQQGKSSYGK